MPHFFSEHVPSFSFLPSVGRSVERSIWQAAIHSLAVTLTDLGHPNVHPAAALPLLSPPAALPSVRPSVHSTRPPHHRRRHAALARSIHVDVDLTSRVRMFSSSSTVTVPAAPLLSAAQCPLSERTNERTDELGTDRSLSLSPLSSLRALPSLLWRTKQSVCPS